MSYYEKLRRILKPIKYNTSHQDFLSMIAANPTDEHSRGVYADWLEDNESHLHTPKTLKRLRDIKGPAWVHRDGEGNIRTGKVATKEQIQEWLNTNQHPFVGSTLDDQIHNGPGGSYFVLKTHNPTNSTPDDNAIIRWSHYWKQPLHDNYGYALHADNQEAHNYASEEADNYLDHRESEYHNRERD